MVDVKRLLKDFFLFGSGAAAGYTVNELKKRDTRRKVRLGVIGSMGAVYALYMTLNHLGPNYLDYRKELELMKEKHQYSIDSMRIEKGYDNPEKQINEFEKQMDEYGRKINDKISSYDTKMDNLVPTLEDKIGKNVTTQIDQKLTQKINPLYSDQKKILEELSKQKVVTKQESKNIIDSITDIFSDDDNKPTTPKTGSKVQSNTQYGNYSRFIIDIDKSTNTLSLLGADNKVLYSCPVSLSRSGGPPSGNYKIQTIAARGGDLYPGVMKLTDILVITGAGVNNQYEDAILNRQNVTKTGARITTDDYNNILSQIRDKDVSVVIN